MKLIENSKSGKTVLKLDFKQLVLSKVERDGIAKNNIGTILENYSPKKAELKTELLEDNNINQEEITFTSN